VFPSAATMESSPTRPHLRHKAKNVLLSAAAILVALAMAAAILLHHYWPFTESAVRDDLASATSANVRFGRFHDRYFPPGCIAENVIFERKNSSTPLITIRRLVIRSYLPGMLRHHVSFMGAEGMQVRLAGSDFAKKDPGGQQTTVDRLVADDAVLELGRGQQDRRFVFHKFTVRNLGGSGPIYFSAIFDNPTPAGLIRTSGQFGPWDSSHSENTAVSGEYALEHADLGVFGGIAGILSSSGRFRGTLNRIDIDGLTDTPQFEVTKTHHHLPLDTHFTASVNALNGDVVLHQVQAHFGQSNLTVKGTIARGPNGKRAAILDLHCERGRIEDAFYPFVHDPRSPITGGVAFSMKVTIPGGSQPFLERLDLASNFQIQHGQFTGEKTQHELNKIAEEPGQKQPDQTLAHFAGSVAIHHGVAYFSSLSVEDQGASALFHGSYNLINERVNMYGKLKTATSLTKTTHGGISAVFAKVMEPFFKKRPHVNVVPVKIGGTYTRPRFGLNM
jgi:AsmA-like C-terminal region